MTNREKLIEEFKSMSVDKLADFIADVGTDDLCHFGPRCEYCAHNYSSTYVCHKVNCRDGIKIFLESEAKE